LDRMGKTSEGKVIQNWEYFVELLLKGGLYRGK